ncbi:helix-turn-helix domain-containing protein [Streptomyces niveus]|uniref:helix-turn-helix domain-containing protein n=1 Tax=Streptomyces niveus TaxID=193462 RepID=UPI0036D41147
MPLRSDGVELRRRRELLGLTATEFAKRAGFTLTHVSQVELGNSNAGPRYLLAAAKILDCEIEEITAGAMPIRPRVGSATAAGAS